MFLYKHLCVMNVLIKTALLIPVLDLTLLLMSLLYALL